MKSPDSLLARFTRDLTAEARAGRLEPVRCRAPEIERVMDILLRHGKNNPALVGAAGVGKTAIVEGLAQRIAEGDVPLVLRDVRLLAVDHVSLLAGTTYRGQYEERIQAMVEETSAAPDIVLFIDELHNLIGQGSAMGMAMDAANMLKPALVRGDFRVIGATTDEEYERWICADPALERRFQKVGVRELSSLETMDILRARVTRLERHHNVVISEDALQASIDLTDEYVRDRMRPDRAIDALDEACAHAQARARYSPETERLVIARRAALREGADAPAPREPEPVVAAEPEAAATGAGPAREGGAQPDPRPRRDAAEGDTGDETLPLDRFAQNASAALERFGAELEAMFATPPGGPDDEELVGMRPRPRPRPAAPPRAGTAADRTRLAELDAALARRLMEEGLVVRGHDVARVVAIAVGEPVTWPAA